MKKNSLNHVYRLVWNASLGCWQAVTELAKGKVKGRRIGAIASPRALSAVALVSGAFLSGSAWADGILPTGGTVVAGQASIAQSGSVMNITQGTDRAAINWQSFNIGAGNTVNFYQPSSSAIILNRVIGSDVSTIQGAINANGNVYLINPNGVLFTKTAQVNVGGIVASTLNLSNDDLLNKNTHRFSGDSAASVENQGTINGSAIALVAARIVNSGTLTGNKVGLAAGKTVTVDLGGPVLVEVNEGALNAAIEQSGTIKASGGTVILTAKAADKLSTSVINHSGITDVSSLDQLTGGGSIKAQADTITHTGTLKANGGGNIDIAASLYNDSGITSVDGDIAGRIAIKADEILQSAQAQLSASGNEGGNIEVIGDLDHGRAEIGGAILATGRRKGGFIETSAAKLLVLDSAKINTSSSEGDKGTWLLDPYDFTIAASGGDITGAALSTALQNNSVTITTSATKVSCSGVTGCGSGTSTGSGDINVNDSITYTGNNSLLLQAVRDINVNKAMQVGNGGLTLWSGRNININDAVTVKNVEFGAVGSINVNAVVTINAGATAAFSYGTDASFNPQGDPTPTDTAALNMGMNQNGFTGKINVGSGTTVTINGSTYTVITTGAQLAGITTNDASVKYVLANDLDLSSYGNWSPIGANSAFPFKGRIDGLGHAVTNLSFSSNNVSGVFGGGLFGYLRTATVINLGVGGTIDLSVSANGAISAGGLAATANSSSVLRNVYSTAKVTLTKTLSLGASSAGGLVGEFAGTLSNAFAKGDVTANNSAGSNSSAGGLIGSIASTSTVSSVYATGAVKGGSTALTASVGGLIGNLGGAFTLNNTYATGSVTGLTSALQNLGGLIGNLGANINVNIDGVFATGAVVAASGGTIKMGGLAGSAGNASQKISNAYFDSNSTKQTAPVSSASTQPGLPNVSDVSIGNANNTLAGTFGNLDSTKWGISNGTPYLKALAPAVTTSQIYLQLSCGTSCFNTYGDAPVINFGAYNAASSGTLLTDAALTGTATYSVYQGATLIGTSLTNLTDAGTYTITYTGGLTSGNSNYIINATPGSVTWTVNKRALTVDLAGAAGSPLSKTYDGGLTLQLSAANYTLGNFVGTQGAGALLLNTTGTFNSKDVATANLVTVSLTAANLSMSSGAKASNYTLPTTVTKAGTITAKALTISGTTVADRQYDGTTVASVTVGTLSGLVTVNGVTETLINTAVGTFADKDVSLDANGNVIAKNVTVAYTLADSTSGKASNYTLANETKTAKINKKDISLNLVNASVATRDYDGTRTASLTGSTFTTLVAGENLGVSALFDTADAGVNKSVGTYTLSDGTNGKASNYNLTGTIAPPTGFTGTINKKALTVTGTTVANRDYNGTTAATVTVGTLSGLVTVNGVTETLGTTSATGTFADQNAGDNKNVTVAYTLADGATGKANNYTLANESKTATINKKALTITGTTVADKTYNGDATAQVTAVGTLSGLVNNETLGTTTATGSFANKNVALDANGNVIAQNATVAYILADGAATTTSTLTGIGQANYGLAKLQNPTLTQDQYCASAGALNCTITTTPGALASNYSLANGTVSAKINKKDITAITGITAANKTYDGSANATLTTTGEGIGFTGRLGNDVLSVATATGNFADKNANDNKTVNITGLTLGGTDAVNYNLTSTTATTTANIAKKTLTFTTASVDPKQYDGTNLATLYPTSIPSADGSLQGVVGLVGNETFAAVAGSKYAITATGQFAVVDAATNIPVNNIVYTFGAGVNGALASNYAPSIGNISGTILPREIILSGATVTAADKTYDGNIAAVVTLTGGSFKIATRVLDANGNPTGYTYGDAGQLVGTERLGVTNVGGNFEDKNAGDNKNFFVVYALTNGTAGDGFTAGKASNYALLNNADAAITTSIPKFVTASIFKKALTLSGAVVAAANKTYDGTTAATVTVTGGTFSGLVSGETLGTTTATGVFDDKNAGTDKNVTVTFVLANGSGRGAAKASNYFVADLTSGVKANVTPKALTITGSSIANKVYDAGTAASVTVGTLGGLIGTETLGTTTATGTFAGSDVGANQDVAVVYTLADNGAVKASNYSLAGQTLKGEITQRTVNVSGNNLQKFAGAADPTLTYTIAGPTATTGLLGTDTLVLKLSRDAGEVVGNYAVKLDGKQKVGNNYTLVFTNGKLEIVAARTMQSDIAGEMTRQQTSNPQPPSKDQSSSGGDKTGTGNGNDQGGEKNNKDRDTKNNSSLDFGDTDVKVVQGGIRT